MKKLLLYSLIALSAVFGITKLALPEAMSRLVSSNKEGLSDQKLSTTRSTISQNQARVAKGEIPVEKSLTPMEEIQQILNLDDFIERETALKYLLHKLVGSNATEAADLVLAIEASDVREEVLRRVMRMWADKDPAAAVAYAEKIPNPSDRKSALLQACVQLSDSDPQKAVQYVTANHLERDLPDLLTTLGARWAASDFSAASQWVKAQPVGEQRDGLVAQISYVRAQSNPAEAARLVVEQIPQGPARNEATISVVHQWGLRDWNEASAWVATFTDSVIRERATAELNQMVNIKLANSRSGKDE